MKRLIFVACVVLMAFAGGFVFGGGVPEEEPEEGRTVRSGRQPESPPVLAEEDEEADWKDRVGEDSESVPRGTGRRNSVKDRILAAAERKVPEARGTEPAGVGLTIDFGRQEVPEVPAQKKEPAPAKQPAATGSEAREQVGTGLDAVFETTGFSIGGSASVSYSASTISASSSGSTGTSDEYTTGIFAISVMPKFALMVAPKFSLGIIPSFYWRQYTLIESEIYERTVYFGISADFAYYLYGGSAIVPSVGGSVGVLLYPETDNQFSEFHILVSPDVYVYFFTSSTFAPFVGIHGNFEFNPDSEYPTIGASADLGFAVFLPKKVRSTF